MKVEIRLMKVLWSKLEAKLLQGLLEFCNRQNLSLNATPNRRVDLGFEWLETFAREHHHGHHRTAWWNQLNMMILAKELEADTVYHHLNICEDFQVFLSDAGSSCNMLSCF